MMIRTIKEFDEITNINKDGLPLFLYGAGSAGQRSLSILNNMKIPVEDFCVSEQQNNPKQIMGKKIIEFKDIKAKYEKFAVLIAVGEANKNDIVAEVKKQPCGVEILFSIDDLCGYFYKTECMKIEEIKPLLADEKSYEILQEYVRYREAISYEELFALSRPIQDQYFDNEVIQMSENETFVDAGVFDGKTTLEFARLVKNNYNAVLLFEPDTKSYRISKKTLEASGKKRCYIFDEGLFSEKKIVRFTNTGDGGSRIDMQGESIDEIKVVALDDKIKEIECIKEVTFIKMDIEGSEAEALIGAKEILKKDKPKLAVCLYHKWEDIYDIPKLVKSIRPDYKIYIRHYNDPEMLKCGHSFWEAFWLDIIMYAI